MLPLKWRLYKIFNYILLVIGLLFFCYVFYLVLFNPPNDSELVIIPILIDILFLMMTIHSVINVTFSIKNFPDKALTGGKRSWNSISIITNILSALGLFVFLIAGAVAEFDEDPYETARDQTGKLILLFLLLLLIADIFVLVCQFTLSSYLRRNANDQFNSMIESIGKE